MLKDISDHTSIAGSCPGSTTTSEMQAQASVEGFNNLTLSKATSKIMRSIDWNLRFKGDINSEVKYASSPDISYFGSSSLCLVPIEGRLLFQKPTNEPATPNFEVNQSTSTLSSSNNSTVVASLDISTKSGLQVNPLAPLYPSTNFSPNRSWISVLFPINLEMLLKISIMELLQLGLVRLVEHLVKEDTADELKGSNNIEEIIVDNEDIQNRIIAEATI